nr:piggyBac transposable element-derived protein 4-like [Nerophis lumbriciformis]
MESSDSEKTDHSSDNQDDSDESMPTEESLNSDEEEDENDVRDDGCVEDTTWRSRNKGILWSSSHEVAQDYVHPPVLMSGPTYYALARTCSPESAFFLYFTEDMVHLILSCTNLQGRRAIPGWKDVSEVDLRAYLGLLILSGVFRSHHESTKSLWGKESGRALFAATMSEKRFCQINKVLCFDDRPTRPDHYGEDRLAPILDLWRTWSGLLPKMFNPGRDVCVGQQLVSFRGRCSFKQCIPSKPAKYGLKIWALCDVSTSYAWKMRVYTGRSSPAQREKTQGTRVVLDLSDGLKGHTVTTDNYFTSFPLAAELRKREMALVGTIRHNKPQIPPQLLLTKDRQVFSSVFAFLSDRTLVSYVPKRGKNVLLMSTKHRAPEVERSVKRKPQMVLDYAFCKRAADHLDQACATYTCRRKSRRWPMTLFYHMVDVSCFNAFVIFTSVNPEWNANKGYRRRVFLETLGRALVAPAMANRSRPPREGFAARAKGEEVEVKKEEENEEEEESQPGPSRKRRQCCLCTQRRRVITQCSTCGKPTCNDHFKRVCYKCCL